MLEITVSLIFLLLALWITWRWKHTSIFLNNGIPGPKPNIIFGNIIELFIKGPNQCHKEWVEKYGSVVGYYYGMKPVLLVADPQLLKDIFIKDFSKFINREPFHPLSNPLSVENNLSVLVLRDKKWKEVRSVLTPTFSTAKMRKMATTMNSSIDTMLDVMKTKANNKDIFNIHDLYQRLTLDVITKTAFGVDMDVQRKSNPKVLDLAKFLFSMPYNNYLLFIGLSFPLLRRVSIQMQQLISRLLNRGASPFQQLRKGLRRVIESRRKFKETHKPDLLQLMIDTKITESKTEVDVKKLEAGNQEDEKEVETSSASSKMSRHMTDDEIIASSVTVLLAGYETTSTALAFTTYLLGKNPDIQEKAYEEIEELVQTGEKLEYGTISKLPYLDKVFNESLRIYPPVTLFTNRYASEDLTYGSLKVPEGMIVQAPALLLHHDPDYWPDPEVFDPSRFETKPNSNGITFFPFGIGPRNCMGMRFAQMEAKLALAHTLYNFKIHLAQEQMIDFPVSTLVRTITPKKGVKVRLEIRKHESIE